MKRPQLEKLLGKKLGGAAGGHSGGQTAVNRREQALKRKQELLEKLRKKG